MIADLRNVAYRITKLISFFSTLRDILLHSPVSSPGSRATVCIYSQVSDLVDKLVPVVA